MLYLVMELLEGRNLEPAPGGQQAASAARSPTSSTSPTRSPPRSRYTHEQGIVHRDLKPANIMRLTDGTVKICDFGIARLGHDIGFTSRLTGTGIAMGTPHYMSPEQISGGEVDHRSDLYSCGCVLYEIATGAPPFDLDDAWAVLVGHRDTLPEPPRSHRRRDARVLRADHPRPARQDPRATARATPNRPATADRLGRGPAQPHGRSSPRGPSGPEQPPSREPRLPVLDPRHDHRPQGDRRRGPRHRAAGPRRGTDRRVDRPPTASGPRRRRAPGPSAPRPPPELLTALAGRHNAGLSLGRLGRWDGGGRGAPRGRRRTRTRPRARPPRHPRQPLRGRLHPQPHRPRRRGAAASTPRGRAGGSGSSAPTIPTRWPPGRRRRTSWASSGRHFEAHQGYAAVLAARERTMGPDHPDTLRCRHNLAFNLEQTGAPGGLVPHGVRGRRGARPGARRRRIPTRWSPGTKSRTHSVSWGAGPRPCRRTGGGGRPRRALGPDHPDTLAARYEVGISLGRLGRSAEALELYRELWSTTAPGCTGPPTPRPCAPGTASASTSAGSAAGRRRSPRPATCAPIRERVLGADHPDTLVSRREVAVGLGWLGRWADALAEYRRVAAARERVLGADHPDTLASRNDEAHCLEQLGRRTEAVELYRRVAALRQQRGTQER